MKCFGRGTQYNNNKKRKEKIHQTREREGGGAKLNNAAFPRWMLTQHLKSRRVLRVIKKRRL